MHSIKTIYVLVFTIPAITSLICALLSVLYYNSRENNELSHKELSVRLIHFYITTGFGWLSMICYIALPSVFIYLNAFSYLSVLLTQVILYHFAFCLTKISRNEKFTFIHYLIPIIVFIAFLLASLLAPFDIQRSVAYGNKIDHWFFIFSYSKLPLFFFYNLIYSILCIYRINRFKRQATKQPSNKRYFSTFWLYSLIPIVLSTLPLPFVLYFLAKEQIFNIIIIIIPITITIVKYIVLCYNTIAGNYVVVYPDDRKKHHAEEHQKQGLNKERFEKYMCENKPYLNPKLKIADLILPLYTNRTYLSSFINCNYGMSFNQFINACRLHEFTQLRNNPLYASLSEQELAEKAGFCNYRSYLRTKTNRSKECK
ncbi:AraC-like DNA-binding protein [Dysgonomonas sp. PH5-45]|uniref:hypothetical protein n=1 Tax=unclassified Dysgonomonas TaxID=2630389 RepID=UPI002476EFE2|nr:MULTISPECIES: hypothetical protein [unclassified Dysgonomonas]MDH6354236.1 AraC-like DNA-binding protein [Dysgonomonas sp. PH5-45]MDH6387137.1 AraC-like DNA-binding protein [Dysgonomonas sp. PH5-37]